MTTHSLAGHVCRWKQEVEGWFVEKNSGTDEMQTVHVEVTSGVQLRGSPDTTMRANQEVHPVVSTTRGPWRCFSLTSCRPSSCWVDGSRLEKQAELTLAIAWLVASLDA